MSKKNITEGVVRKGGVGQNNPKQVVNQIIGKPGQLIIPVNQQSSDSRKPKK